MKGNTGMKGVREREREKERQREGEREKERHFFLSLCSSPFLPVSLPPDVSSMDMLCSGRSKAMSQYTSECTTSIHCAVVERWGGEGWGVGGPYSTVASNTRAGSSMSALLWTILSSNWAGVGRLPGPAISAEGERERDIEERQRQRKKCGQREKEKQTDQETEEKRGVVLHYLVMDRSDEYLHLPTSSLHQ